MAALLLMLTGCADEPGTCVDDDAGSDPGATDHPDSSPEPGTSPSPTTAPDATDPPGAGETPGPDASPTPGPDGTPSDSSTPNPGADAVASGLVRISSVAAGNTGEGADLDGDGIIDNQLPLILEALSVTIYSLVADRIAESELSDGEKAEALDLADELIDVLFTLEALSAALDAPIEADARHFLVQLPVGTGAGSGAVWSTGLFHQVGLVEGSDMGVQPGVLDASGHGIFGPGDLTLTVYREVTDRQTGETDTIQVPLVLYESRSDLYRDQDGHVAPFNLGGAMSIEDLLGLLEQALLELNENLPQDSQLDINTLLEILEEAMTPYADINLDADSELEGVSIGLVLTADPAVLVDPAATPVPDPPPTTGQQIDDYFRVTSVTAGDPDEGVDVDGDGTVDNNLETLLDGLGDDVVNGVFNALVAAGVPYECTEPGDQKCIENIMQVVEDVVEEVFSLETLSDALNQPVELGVSHFLLEVHGPAGGALEARWYTADYTYLDYSLGQLLGEQAGALDAAGDGLFGPADLSWTWFYTEPLTNQTGFEFPITLHRAQARVSGYNTGILEGVVVGGAIATDEVIDALEPALRYVSSRLEMLGLNPLAVDEIVAQLSNALQSYEDVDLDGDGHRDAISFGLILDAWNIDDVGP